MARPVTPTAVPAGTSTSAWTDRRLRRLLAPHAVLYAGLVAAALFSAVVSGSWDAWAYTAIVTAACSTALFGHAAIYRIGQLDAQVDEARRTVGRWMAEPVDDDGMPSYPPVTGRFVVDDITVERPRS